MRHSKPARPGWAGRIEKFRQELGLSQAALAKRLNVSAMAPSRWERGINQPPASVYIKLGKLAGDPNCWYFWERAGIRKSDLTFILSGRDGKSPDGDHPSIEIISSGTKAKLSSANKDRNLLAIPLYNTTPAVGVSAPTKIYREEAAEFVVAPLAWCPHPESTYCLRLSGNKMAPILQHGSVFAVDEVDANPEKLVGKIVLASNDAWGLTVHWLRRYGRTTMLVPENEEHPPVYIDSDWKILGKVLWWHTKAP